MSELRYMARPFPASLETFSKGNWITSPFSELKGREPANSNPTSRAKSSQVAPSPKRRIRAFGNTRRQLRNAEICTASVSSRRGLGELKRIIVATGAGAWCCGPGCAGIPKRPGRQTKSPMDWGEAGCLVPRKKPPLRFFQTFPS